MTDYYFYPYKELTGGNDGALDSLDGALTKEGDGAITIGNNGFYVHRLESSNAAESSPSVIIPDANNTGKRWVLKYASNNLSDETNWLVKTEAHNNVNNDSYDVYRLPVQMHEVLSRYVGDHAIEESAGRNSPGHRGVLVSLNNNAAVGNSTLTKISWETVNYDTDVCFNANNATRLTAPLGARVVKIKSTVVFEANNTGMRGVVVLKNNNELLGGGRVYVPAIEGGTATVINTSSCPVQCNNNDYFEIQAYHTAGGNLSISQPFTCASLEVTAWHPQTYRSKRLLIAQGAYQLYNGSNNNDDSNLEGLANNMAQFGVVCLSHIDTHNLNGCVDTRYNYITRLIRAIRNVNPQTKIYGYVTGTADAPEGCGYANNTTQGDTGWGNNLTTAPVFLSRVQNWYNLPARPDGILIDLVAPEYLTAALRDNIYQACKLYGFGIMVNTTYPSYLNVDFACSSQYIGHGDYCLIEGFRWSSGNNTEADTNNALVNFAAYRVKGLRLAALCTEAWASNRNDVVDQNNTHNSDGTTMFNLTYQRGDIYHYDTSDLGIVTQIVQTPGIT